MNPSSATHFPEDVHMNCPKKKWEVYHVYDILSYNYTTNAKEMLNFLN